MRKIFLFLLAVCTSLVISAPVRAQEETLQVLAVTTMRRQTPLPKVVTGKAVIVKEAVNQDLLVLSETIDVTAPVEGNLVAAGREINISGTVRENLIVAGGDIIIKGTVVKNLIVLGGNVTLAEGSLVDGYLVAAGGKLNLLGRVAGDVRLIGSEVTVGNRAILDGKLIVDGKKVDVSSQAIITGEKQIKIIEDKAEKESPQTRIAKTKAVVGAGLFAGVVWFLGELLLLVVLVRLFGHHITKTTKLVVGSFWGIMGWGFIKLFVAPFLILFLLMTIVGIPLAFLTMAAYVTAICLAKYITAAVLGHFMRIRGWVKTDSLYIQAGLGLLIIAVIGLVPFIGWIFKFGVLLTGLGVVINWERGLLRNKSVI